jgi:hypothetical protein
MNLRSPQNRGNFLTGCGTVSFSRRTLLHGVSRRKEGGKNVNQERKQKVENERRMAGIGGDGQDCGIIVLKEKEKKEDV